MRNIICILIGSTSKDFYKSVNCIFSYHIPHQAVVHTWATNFKNKFVRQTFNYLINQSSREQVFCYFHVIIDGLFEMYTSVHFRFVSLYLKTVSLSAATKLLLLLSNHLLYRIINDVMEMFSIFICFLFTLN